MFPGKKKKKLPKFKYPHKFQVGDLIFSTWEGKEQVATIIKFYETQYENVSILLQDGRIKELDIATLVLNWKKLV